MDTDIAEKLRDAIRRCGETATALAENTGVTQPTITRFLRGDTDLRISNAAKIAAYLGLDLTKRRKR